MRVVCALAWWRSSYSGCSLAINGTVNDVCMSGATPLYLAAAFILEEGLPMATLHRVLLSMEKAAKSAKIT